MPDTHCIAETDAQRRERFAAHLATLDQCSAAYDQTCRDLYDAMDSAQREVLWQLVERGPVWDGDICSKQARGDLFDMGLAGRAYVKGEAGYSVANYRGGNVLRSRVRKGGRGHIGATEGSA